MDGTQGEVEYKPLPLQQGVRVQVVSGEELREAWKRFKRDDYEDDMLKVAGKQGTILHQHPSGAFTVIFEGKPSGLKKGEKYRFKFPPRALTSCDVVPVKKRKPKLPKHIKVSPKGKTSVATVPRTSEPPPPPPPMPTAQPSMLLVDPEVVNEPPPDCTSSQKQIDPCLQPPPKLADPEDQKLSTADARMLAIREDEDHVQMRQVQDLPTSPSPPPPEPTDSDEEAAFLAEQAREEEEALAEEEAFLDELDDGSASPSPSPQREARVLVEEAPSTPGPLPLRNTPTIEVRTVVDSGPRVQVIYEPHGSVVENAIRFGGAKHGGAAFVDPNHIKTRRSPAEPVKEPSPRRQVLQGESLRVGDLRARFDQ